ncbi:hypothetical protein J2129_000017 [Methanofollis sp. W23]|nr:hypothetical protein [Methanofollis sp. W23]
MNMMERINKELKRRTKVVGAFPNENSLLRLAGSILMDINEEWVTGRRYFDDGEGMIKQGDRDQTNYRRSETLTFILFIKYDSYFDYDQFYDFNRYIFWKGNIFGCDFLGGEYFNN